MQTIRVDTPSAKYDVFAGSGLLETVSYTHLDVYKRQTHNPFVAYTSNIAAILGLRSLYFALAGLLDRFRYLHYGLGALLAFVAFKMLASRWIAIPIVPSLAVIGAILAVCAVASSLAKGREQEIGNRE